MPGATAKAKAKRRASDRFMVASKVSMGLGPKKGVNGKLREAKGKPCPAPIVPLGRWESKRS